MNDQDKTHAVSGELLERPPAASGLHSPPAAAAATLIPVAIPTPEFCESLQDYLWTFSHSRES